MFGLIPRRRATGGFWDGKWGMLLLDTTFYLLHLHFHVVDIIIITRAWYYPFHYKKARVGGGGGILGVLYSITLVLRFRDVFNDTNTLPLRRWEKFDSTIPILDEISPHPKSHPEKKNPRQDEPVQPDMEAKPRQDSVSPNPPPSPSGIDTTRHDVRVVPRTYSSWLVLSNALVHWHGRMDGWHSLHFYYRSCLTSATHDVRDCVFGGTGRQRWRRGGGASDVPMGMGRGVVWLVVRAGVRGLKDGGLLRRSGWWCDGWLPVVVVGRRWFVFSACLGLCHVEYLVWWLGESTGWVTGSRETMSWWRCLHSPHTKPRSCQR